MTPKGGDADQPGGKHTKATRQGTHLISPAPDGLDTAGAKQLAPEGESGAAAAGAGEVLFGTRPPTPAEAAYGQSLDVDRQGLLGTIQARLDMTHLTKQGRVDLWKLFCGTATEETASTVQLAALANHLEEKRREGIVVKNYQRFGADKKVLMGKFVSEAFKEIHGKEWRAKHLNSEGILLRLVDTYRTPARWQKALQHLQERGELEQSPRDIGKLVSEIPADVEAECGEEIKAKLWEWAWPTIRRGIFKGAPEWYKEKLMEQQLTKEGP